MTIAIVGKIWLLPLSKENEDFIRDSTSVKRVNKYPSDEIVFSLEESVCRNLRPEDIMCLMGYNPLGYGPAYKIERKNGMLSFCCSGSCD